MNFVVGVMILGRVPIELTGGVHLPSATYSQRGRDHVESSADVPPDSGSTTTIDNSDSLDTNISQECDDLTSNDAAVPPPPPAAAPWEETLDCKQAEYDIFLFLQKLLDREGKLGMAGLWQSKAPSMKLRVYQLDRILRWMLPRLHAHFIEIQLTPEVIVAQWFITLFSYTVPLQWTMQIWGYVFSEGWPALFRVVLSLLQILEDTILDVDLEGVRSSVRR